MQTDLRKLHTLVTSSETGGLEESKRELVLVPLLESSSSLKQMQRFPFRYFSAFYILFSRLSACPFMMHFVHLTPIPRQSAPTAAQQMMLLNKMHFIPHSGEKTR